MKSHYSFLLVLGWIIVSLSVGCGSSTKVTGSWKAEETPTEFRKLAVIGITPRAEGRKAIELKLEELLLQEGIPALGGLNFLPPAANEENTSLPLLLEFLNQEKADGVLTVSVLRVDDNRRYVPGSYYYYPTQQTYLTDYYGQMRNYVYLPGYSYESLSVFLEANLYTYPEGKLLWSAQTRSLDVTNLDEGASQVARSLVKDLVGNNVILSASGD